MLLNNSMTTDQVIATAYIADWEKEKEELSQNFRQKILWQMETTDISRLAFIASKEWNTAMQENLEREIRWRKYRNEWGEVDINELKEKVDILDLLESLVGTVRWRKWWLIACPLPDHKDRTASFSLHRDKWFFVCFGCWKKGSVIDLVMEINKCDLKTAIQTLKSYL